MYVKIAAIVGTVAIVAIATLHGINGVIMATGMLIVSGIGGYEIGVKKK